MKPYLKKGDAVSLVLPSSSVLPAVAQKACQMLEENGLVPLFDPASCAPDQGAYGVYYSYARYANNDAQRVQNFQKALMEDSAALWALTGGYGAQVILAALERGEIQLPATPKVLIGFSDITVLHQYFLAKGWPALHGLTLGVAAEMTPITGRSVNDKESLQGLISWLLSPTPVHYDLTLLHCPAAAQGITLNAMVVGGNLTLLTETLGTPTSLDGTGKIVFLEDTPERPERAERRLMSLIRAGVLSGAKAVFLGDMPCEGNALKEGVSLAQKEALTPLLNRRLCGILAENGLGELPVVYSPAFGHGAQNRVLPLDAPATLSLNGTQATLTFL